MVGEPNWYERNPSIKSGAQEGRRAIDARIAEAIWGLRLVDLGKGNHRKAAEASELCLYFASRSYNAEIMLRAHHAFWGVYIYSYAIAAPLYAVMMHTQTSELNPWRGSEKRKSCLHPL